jgi:hypothetical protein
MISLVRLAEILGITDEAEFEQLEQQRDAALAYIESATNMTFGPATSTTYMLAGSGTSRLYLPEPVSVVSAVSEYSYAGATAEALALTTDYLLRAVGRETYLLRVGSGAIWDRDYEYAVTSTVGYAEDAGPKDVEALLIELVRQSINAGGEEVMKSETIGGYSYVRFDSETLSAGAQETLKHWRRLVFA